MGRVACTVRSTPRVVNADKVDGFNGTDLAFGTAVIPSGMTVTGYEAWVYANIADNARVYFPVMFPARAPTALDLTHVNFAPSVVGIDDDAACTGTFQAPSAPAGKVCIYPGVNDANVDGGSGDTASGGHQDRGFGVHFLTNSPTVGAAVSMDFSWAYKAP